MRNNIFMAKNKKGTRALTSAIGNINFCPKSKHSQVTIFIIIAIVIVVAAVIGYIAYENRVFAGGLPTEMQPIEETFLSCLKDYASSGADILGTQGGYIYLPDFEPGSTYMPFSSQLDFMGNSIPYWYYISGNNIQKEQVPSKAEMESQLEQFIEEKARNCVFESYYNQGFEIIMSEPKTDVTISDSNINFNLDMDMRITKGENSRTLKKHSVKINSNLGRLYNSAKKVYDYEQDNLFLEEYAVDTLRLYAPVDGVEVTCSPKTWIAEDVFDELKQAVEANTFALKTKGDNKDYFAVDIGVSEDVRFINSPKWPYMIEVEDDDGILIANPIGNQQGLGILGFCYVPYHFVYNLRYPVLIQVSDENEIFQFPVAVVIQQNNPRKALTGNSAEFEVSELCKYKNNWINLNVKNAYSDNIDADISFECLGTKCNIGETKDGSLSTPIPQCMNGYLRARAEGYESGRYLYNSIESGSANIILNKLHKLDVNLKLDRKQYDGNAIVNFISNRSSRSISYPEQKIVELSEGEYEISVYVYSQGNIQISSSVAEQCVEIPRSGLFGIAGLTKKKCFDIEMPEQLISDVLSGGGKQNDYFLESQLENSNTIEIGADSIAVPKTIEDLQTSYVIFDSRGLEVRLK